MNQSGENIMQYSDSTIIKRKRKKRAPKHPLLCTARVSKRGSARGGNGSCGQGGGGGGGEGGSDGGGGGGGAGGSGGDEGGEGGGGEGRGEGGDSVGGCEAAAWVAARAAAAACRKLSAYGRRKACCGRHRYS